jgi:hypothetical protein
MLPPASPGTSEARGQDVSGLEGESALRVASEPWSTLLTQAYRIAPAGDVAVFEYSAIIWVPLWGLVFFDEIPKLSTVIGAALICGAGLFALRTSRRAAAYS